MQEIQATYTCDEETVLYASTLFRRLYLRPWRIGFFVFIGYALYDAFCQLPKEGDSPMLMAPGLISIGLAYWMLQRMTRRQTRQQFCRSTVANCQATWRISEQELRVEYSNGSVTVLPWERLSKVVVCPTMVLLWAGPRICHFIPLTAMDDDSLEQLKTWAIDHRLPVRRTGMRLNLRRIYPRMGEPAPNGPFALRDVVICVIVVVLAMAAMFLAPGTSQP